MGEEKRNKVVAAVTINAVLLVFIILAVLIAQIVQISVLKRRKNALINEYYRLEQELEASQNFVDRYEKDEAIQELIVELKKLGMTDEEIILLVKPSEKN